MNHSYGLSSIPALKLTHSAVPIHFACEKATKFSLWDPDRVEQPQHEVPCPVGANNCTLQTLWGLHSLPCFQGIIFAFSINLDAKLSHFFPFIFAFTLNPSLSQSCSSLFQYQISNLKTLKLTSSPKLRHDNGEREETHQVDITGVTSGEELGGRWWFWPRRWKELRT